MPTVSLRDCSTLVTAVLEAGGKAPEVLTNILAGAALLNTHSVVSDPAKAIVAVAADGSLTAEKLNELVTEAASTQAISIYVGELRQRSERMFVEAFHKALAAGACDELLDTLRPAWTEHAEAIGAARTLLGSAESSAESILASGEAGAISAWQSLPEHITVIDRIGAIASQFAPRLGHFPLIKEAASADGHRLEDRAIWCADGNLEVDSAAFRRPGTHRHSPWANVPLRLHSVDSARERYRIWASAQWEQQHSGPRGGYIDEDGKMHEHPRPANPYAEATQ